MEVADASLNREEEAAAEEEDEEDGLSPRGRVTSATERTAKSVGRGDAIMQMLMRGAALPQRFTNADGVNVDLVATTAVLASNAAAFSAAICLCLVSCVLCLVSC